MPEWDDEIDGLYALEPGEFVAARNALAKRIKADGDKERAAEVARLSRPTIVAWALNRAVRDDPDRVTALIDAAAQLTSAQADLMAGGDREALRTATTARRAAAGELMTAATALTGGSHTDALRNTLDAALADPELVDRLRTGTLSDTLDAPAGFGFGFDAAPAAPARSRAGRRRRRRRRARPFPLPTPDEDDEDEPRPRPSGASSYGPRPGPWSPASRARSPRPPTAVDDATTEVEQTDDDVRDAEDALAAARLAHSEAAAALAAAEAEHDRTAGALDEARRLLAELDGDGDAEPRSAGGPPRSSSGGSVELVHQGLGGVAGLDRSFVGVAVADPESEHGVERFDDSRVVAAAPLVCRAHRPCGATTGGFGPVLRWWPRGAAGAGGRGRRGGW